MSDKYYELGGQFFDNFVDKMIILSLFSLGFIGFFAGDVNLKKDGAVEFLFIIGILSFIISIFLGLLHKEKLNKFLNDVGDSWHKRHEEIENYMYKNNLSFGTVSVDVAIDNLTEIPENFAPWWHKLQIALFFIGALCFSIILIATLFF